MFLFQNIPLFNTDSSIAMVVKLFMFLVGRSTSTNKPQKTDIIAECVKCQNSKCAEVMLINLVASLGLAMSLFWVSKIGLLHFIVFSLSVPILSVVSFVTM